MMNKTALVTEIDELMKHLAEYREALAMEQSEELYRLLQEGRIRKEKSSAGGKI